MDSSTFDENQTQFSVFTDPTANSNDQPVDYGPLVFKVMRALSERLGGVEYLIGESEILGSVTAWYLIARKKQNKTGLSLRTPTNPMISKLAASAQSILGDELDAYLLGNVRVSVVRLYPRDHFRDVPSGGHPGTRSLQPPW